MLRPALPRQHIGIERMVQHSVPPLSSQGSSVRLMPANDEGAIVDRMVASCARRLSSITPSPPASSSRWLRATGTMPPLADIEGDERDMRRGIVLPFAVERRDRVELLGAEQIVERHHAVGQIFAEAAHIADRKHFRSDAHRELAMIEAADTPASDQRLGADARQRRDGVGAAP